MTDRRQRQKEARTAAREAQRKAAARKELRRRIFVGVGLGAVVATVLLLAGTFGSRGPEISDELTAFRRQVTACEGTLPDPVEEMRFQSPINQALRSDATVTATLTTSCGPIVVELAVADHPATVNNFVFLARNSFYNGTVFHRIAPGFVAQGGDPTATGRGGPGYRIPDEFPPAGFVYERGVVAMANAGRGTTGSQFFIVTGDASALGPSFNVLGRVVDGFETLDRIAAVPTRQQPAAVERSYPTQSVYLESVTITVEG